MTWPTVKPVLEEPASEAPAGGGASAGTQTLVRGLRILEAMAAQRQPVGVGELSRELGLPKSTVQRLLRTLEQQGWAETSTDPVTRWRLSPRMLALGRRNAPGTDIRDAAREHIVALGESTGETIHLSVPDRDVSVVLIDRVDSVHPVRTFNALGASSPLHATSSGKAIMAAWPDQQVEAILARPLEAPMPSTIVDPQRIHHQVLEARERGYAVNISENRSHVCAIGAAIVDTSGRPVAAVTISMPDIRFDPRRVPEWGAAVRSTAKAISDSLAGA